MTNGIETQGWWDTSIDQFNMEELHQMHASLDELEQSLLNEICLKIGGNPNASYSLMALPLNPYQATNLFFGDNLDEEGPSDNSFL